MLLGRSSLLRGASNSHTRLTSDSQLRTCVNRNDIIKQNKFKKCYPVGIFPDKFKEVIYWCTFAPNVNCPRDPDAYCPTAATMGTTRTKIVIVTVSVSCAAICEV